MLSFTDIDLSEYTVRFVKGSRITLNAEKVYKELCTIKKLNENSTLLPEEVIEWAKNNPQSEIYKGIDWNDTEAANKWRLHQCRQIIYNIRVIPHRVDSTDIESEENKYKQVVQITPFQHLDGTPGYQSIVEIVNDEDKYNQLKSQALKDLETWRTKYVMITELKDLFTEIDKVLSLLY